MFVIATKNAHKLVEFERILLPLGIEVCSQAAVNVDIDVVEDADSFEGNARLKARAIFEATKLPTIADDSGLEVDALDNAPGIYSARYGDCANDVQRYELVLKNMKGEKIRTARFVCCIYLILADGKEFSFTGVCNGEIGDKPSGADGFGYDPIFYVGKKSLAEIDGAQKDKISHRGRALRALKEFLDNHSLAIENNK